MTFKDRKPCITMTSEEAKAIYDFLDSIACSDFELTDLLFDFKDFYEGNPTNYLDVEIKDED